MLRKRVERRHEAEVIAAVRIQLMIRAKLVKFKCDKIVDPLVSLCLLVSVSVQGFD